MAAVQRTPPRWQVQALVEEEEAALRKSKALSNILRLQTTMTWLAHTTPELNQ